MLYPVRFLFIFTTLLWAAMLHAQCPTPPNANAGPDNTLTCSAFSVSLNGTSTAPGATFIWTGPNGFTATLANPVVSIPGVYTLTVTEPVNGCTATDQTTVSLDAAPPMVNAGPDIILNCIMPSAVLTGNTNALGAAFEWTGPNGFTSNTRNPTVTQAGSYTLIVTNQSNGCTATDQVNVLLDTAMPTISTVGGTLTCSNSVVELRATSNLPVVQWSWTGPNGFFINSADTITPNAGTYTVVATGQNGCTSSVAVTVLQDFKAPIASITGGNNVCPGESITLTATGGSSYLWSNGVTTSSILVAPMAATPYTVTVTGTNGCTAVRSIIIGIRLDLNIQGKPLCNSSSGNGSIDLIVPNGTGPFNFIWSNGATTEDLNNLSPGLYMVSVSDSKGCTGINRITIDTIPGLIKTVLNTCNLSEHDTLFVARDGGIYTFDWAHLPGSNDPSYLINVPAGKYTMTITAANGCTAVRSVTVVGSSPILLNANVNHVSCNGGSNGRIVLTTVTGGTPPYSYIWSNTATTQQLNGIIAGTYTVTVRDANGCTATASATVTQPLPLVINAVVTPAACNSGNAGRISLTVTGGTAPYTYSWSNGTNAQNAINLFPGTYTVTLTDANGCTATATATVTQLTPITMTTTVTHATCNAANGSIMVSVTNVTGVFSYRVLNNFGALFFTGSSISNTFTINDIPIGIYSIDITTGNGCTATATATVTQGSLILSASLTQVYCNGAADGRALVTITGGAMPYTYTVNGGAAQVSNSNTFSLINLPAGVYTITVTDANGCANFLTVTITQPSPLVVTPVFCESLTNIIVSGGILPYTYQWDGGLTGATQPLQPGNYGLTVTDANGCSVAQNIWVSPDPTPCTKIEGSVRMDSNNNCLPEDNELGLGNWMIRATQSNGAVFYAMTGPDGRYVLRVVPGSFTVSALAPANSNAVICNTAIPVNLPQNGSVATASFAVKKVPQCPKMTVDITTFRLRRCFSDNFYTVKYCNNGSVAATDAYVDVTLDSFLVYNTSTRPATALGGNAYRFRLGTVQPNECRSFYIYLTVSCGAVIGQTHCSEAHIYPDSSCTAPNPQWSGAQVEVAGAICASDSLRFALKNTGKSPMGQLLEYIVIEDGIMARMGQSAAPLAAGSSMTVAVPANGRTWRIQARQEPFAPIAQYPALSVEGCTTSSMFSTGFVTQFPTAVNGPWQDIDCTINTGAFDPNDKLGTPLGYGNRHYIQPGTDVEYRIRFQNTGTDTAFTVVIRDTLSAWLDPLTIRPGASSHPYEFEITGKGILVFKFPNITLPDSHINARLSNGFVSYHISQRDSVPLESDILNRAAIYFDFNDPVMTNTTKHRVGANFVTVRLWEPLRPEYAVRVMPQPMTETAQIVVEKVPPDGNYQLDIFDLNGIWMRTVRNSAPNFEVQRHDLAAGMYLFSVKRGEELVGSGKIVVVR